MGLDPNYLYDNADVLWYGTEGYANALGALMKVTGKSEEAVNYMLRGQYGAADFWTASKALEDYGVVAAYNTNGYRCFAFADKVTETVPTGPMYQLDSNATATTVVNAAPVYDVYVDDVAGSATEGKVLVDAVGSTLPSTHKFSNWKFYAGEAIQAIGAVGTGITLGKTIDTLLYNANPEFWEANGMSTLNPETWSSITNGNDSFGAGLFNMIFGINPNTGNAQAFIDQNALAYLAMYMNANGVFSNGVPSFPPTQTSGTIIINSMITPSELFNIAMTTTQFSGPISINDAVQNALNTFFSNYNSGYATVKVPTPQGNYDGYNALEIRVIPDYRVGDSLSLGLNARDTYSIRRIYARASQSSVGGTIYITNPSTGSELYIDKFEGTIVESSRIKYSNVGVTTSTPVEGIGTQQGATVPDTTSWVDLPSTLQSLQNQYPSMFNDAVPNTIVQPDGSTQVITYVPIATPNANGQWDTQPTSSTTSQANPEVEPLPQPTTENNDLLKLILQLITMPEPQPNTQTETETTPQPPIPDLPTTGDGSSPTPTTPTGSASALWSVYHPTQAQINSFGAWLWGSVFTTDIRKLFEDPIQGVIKLHKVFAPPVDSGTGNIVVGTLDSGVSSATVSQQYVEVDCGSVSCEEVFGTVFDYPPFTEVSLYLPFIGIVPLDVNDVMRSTIHVTYGVDVFTGACLAVVEVTRDGNTVVMYQYSGMCSVDYPLTNLQASQMAAGLLGIAAGIAGLVSVGTLAPALGLAGGVGATMKRNVGRSGSFSGNSGAMGIKVPYLIFQRPQPKTAITFPRLSGYPTNYSVRLSECSNHVVCKEVHVSGINATLQELEEIERLLKSGIEI